MIDTADDSSVVFVVIPIIMLAMWLSLASAVRRPRRIGPLLAGVLLAVLAGCGAEDDDAKVQRRQRAHAVLTETLVEQRGPARQLAARLVFEHNYFEDLRGQDASLNTEADSATGPERIAWLEFRLGLPWHTGEPRKADMAELHAALRDPDTAVVRAALHAVTRLGLEKLDEDLARLADASDPLVSLGAHLALVGRGDQQKQAQTDARLAALMQSTDPVVRRAAAEGLLELESLPAKTASALAAASEDAAAAPEATLHLRIARFVHAPEPEDEQQAARTLRAMIDDPAHQRPHDAAVVLGHIGEDADVPRLEAILDDADPPTRLDAANALLRIERRFHRGLQPADWFVVGLYAVGMLGIGGYYARRQSTTEEYFLAGRNMRPSAVGISIFATLLSTISYLASPGELIAKGPTLLLWNMAAMPLVFLIGGYLLIPAIMRMRITSAYELLGARLGLPTHILGATIFIVIRLVWMAMLIYFGSRAIVKMLDWSDDTIMFVAIVAGIVAVIYTTLGGLRTVIVTDVLQFIILMFGALVTVALVTAHMGGFDWFPTEWSSHWDKQPLYGSLTVRVTVAGSLISTLTWWVCTAGSDQVAIQRYLATRDVRAARQAFLVNCGADVACSVVLGLTGCALLGLFRTNPHLIFDGWSLISDADHLFPHYIANYLPIGLGGLVLAAMLSAAMSSLDSGLNSVTTVLVRDFIRPFRRVAHDEQHDVRMARGLVLSIGIVIVLLSTMVRMFEGNIAEITGRTVNLFVAPLFGLFFMAMFVPFTTRAGALIGGLGGLTAAVLIAWWDVITGGPKLSFQWIGFLSLLAHIGVGCAASLLTSGWSRRVAAQE